MFVLVLVLGVAVCGLQIAACGLRFGGCGLLFFHRRKWRSKPRVEQERKTEEKGGRRASSVGPPKLDKATSMDLAAPQFLKMLRRTLIKLTVS